jgi:hypothetical protein
VDLPLSNDPAQPSSHPSVILSGAGTFSYSFELSKGQFPKWVTANGQKYPVPDQRGLNSVRRAREPRNQAQKPFDLFADGLLRKDSRADKTAIELFLSGVRTLALQSSIIDVVRIASRFSTATG